MPYTGRTILTETTSSSHSSLNANDYVEVRDTDGKGMGTFATRTIAFGTRIIAEAGLLQIDRKTSDAATIVQAFESLSSSRQSAYLSLHEFACDSFIRAAERELRQYWENIPKIHRRVLGIWAANSFGDVFLLGSRINHSHIPNVNFAYKSTLGKQTFHARKSRQDYWRDASYTCITLYDHNIESVTSAMLIFFNPVLADDML
ncbi:uncharacterized protein RSE6_14818 [Rhynchosporium secalis]|uniref:SET domain-containing protein n=1 Tax=Rhynchosporium secalis TaxID=38038 RepID=A0A1E1MWS7_RHYSE|nr:uncharacterized protein RSE6_14818 [Rhynchosporium secalis]